MSGGSTSAPRPKKGEADVTQSDLAMNLFMVLMVMLATLAASTAVVTTLGYRVRHKPEAPTHEQAPLGLVRSWAPVQPISPRLVIRDSMVYRLDLTQAAISLARNEKFLHVMNESKLLPQDADPASYQIMFMLLDDPVPSEISAWAFPATSLATASQGAVPAPLVELMALHEQFDIFVFPGQMEFAWDLISVFYKEKKSYRLRFVQGARGSRAPPLSFERSSSHFTFEDIYK